MSFRHYVFPDDGPPLRVSKRLGEGLAHGRDALPQYAGTRQRALSVMLKNDGGKPVRILEAQGSIWVFDWEGRIHEGLQDALVKGMDSAFSSEAKEGTVVDLGSRQKRKRFEDEYRWTPSRADLDIVAADIWPKKKEDRLKSAEGTSRRKPPVTYDAKRALQEASQEFFKINRAIERLKEPSLKGFIFEARERVENDPENQFLYRALAETGEERLEILRRRRSGKGTWYAVIEVTRWISDGSGEIIAVYHECCKGKAAAIKAGRGLLIKHSDAFSDDTSVDASVLTDLEWEQRAYPD